MIYDELINVNLTPETWFWLQISIWIVIIMAIGIIGILAAWSIQEFWLTPLESKTIRKAARKKKGLQILETDDGRLLFRIAEKMFPEGITETKKDKKTKSFWTGLLGRNVEAPKLQHPPTDNLNAEQKAEIEKALKQQKQIFDLLSEQSSKKTHLEGAKIPVNVGYYGKAILTKIGHIASITALQKLDDLKDEVFIATDFTTLKTLFDMPWDQTQLAAQAQQKEQEGFLKGKKASMGNEGFKTILMMLIVVFGLLAAIIVIMKFL